MSTKLKIFMYGFRAYTYILFWSRNILDFFVKKTVSVMPDEMIYPLSPVGDKKTLTNIKIIMAKGFSNKNMNSMNITNAVNLFLNIYWDIEACDDNGGIQIYKFKEMFRHLDLVWMCYLYDIPDEKKIESSSSLNDVESLLPHLKFMLFDLKTEKVYRYDSYSIPGIIGIDHIDIMFGQVTPDPSFKWD